LSIIDLSCVEPGSPIEVSDDVIILLNSYSGIDNSVLKNRFMSQIVEAHVWFFEVNSSSYYHLLSEEERRRLYSFKFGEDRESYLFRHGLLRVLLGYYLGLDPRSVTISHEANSRPFLSSSYGLGVNFSVSHSKRAVMYAFSKKRVGVDVERLRGDVDFDGVALNLLAADDAKRFSDLPHSEKMTLFYKMWTARESSYKAVGGELADFRIKLDESLNLGVDIGGMASRNRVHFFKVFDDYLGALTVPE